MPSKSRAKKLIKTPAQAVHRYVTIKTFDEMTRQHKQLAEAYLRQQLFAGFEWAEKVLQAVAIKRHHPRRNHALDTLVRFKRQTKATRRRTARRARGTVDGLCEKLDIVHPEYDAPPTIRNLKL